ncbi:MAG: tetratricopeptide repeat protein [Acidiferrobacterales bacterium]
MKQLKFALAVLLTCVVGLAHADKSDDGFKAAKAGHYKTAAKILRPLADQGDARAQYNLGVLYSDGRGVPQNYQEAMTWYRKAADQGFAAAQYDLGVVYATGQGVPRSHQEAMTWYRKAADQGLAIAQFNLGLGYLTGLGVPQNNVLAYMLFNLAAAGGNKEAVNDRDFVLKTMIPTEIAEGQKLAAEWKVRTPLPTSY